MGVISRGIKNAFRNTIRSFSITFILGLSIAMALIMLLAYKTVQSKITSVKGSIANTISVSPAGMRGFEGGGTLLTDQNASDIKALSHVSNVIEIMNGRLRTAGSDTSSGPFGNESDSNAVTSLTAPKAEAPEGGSGRKFVVNGQDVTGKSFSMPITVTGINNLSNISALSASSFNLTSGDKIDPTSSDNVANIGQALASQNNLSVGSTFQAYGKDITVKGIFDAGNTFTNGAIVMPIATLQNLSGQSGQINSLIVQVDSIDNLASVSDEIKNKFKIDNLIIFSIKYISIKSIFYIFYIITKTFFTTNNNLMTNTK